VIPPGTRVPWSHDDLVIVCGLYFTLPFGQMHARNSRVAELARLLGRTPSSVAMKLVNLASLDPAHQARGIKGLANHTRADELIWSEFQTNWTEMSLASEIKLEELMALQRFAASDTAPRPRRLPISSPRLRAQSWSEQCSGFLERSLWRLTTLLVV
jgi:hypothetical protein